MVTTLNRRQELSISNTQGTLSRNCHNKCFELLKKASSYTEVKYYRGNILMTQSTECYSRLIACHSIKELGSFSLCPLDRILRRCVRCTAHTCCCLGYDFQLCLVPLVAQKHSFLGSLGIQWFGEKVVHAWCQKFTNFKPDLNTH